MNKIYFFKFYRFVLSWLKLWWFKISSLLVFWYFSIITVEAVRQKIVVVIAFIHLVFFFSPPSFFIQLVAYAIIWELCGVQIDKYQDFDESDPDSMDFISFDSVKPKYEVKLF